MKLGSLFDGIGGFPLAAIRNGIEPVWASEIEAFPIEVTKRYFPDMKHLGDITKINGAKAEPVDIISAGSPCQDLSVAGRREGLAGERSGLFMEFIRIVREMRGATNGVYPRYILWENVPGAFSSNEGQDFRAVLEEIVEAPVPMPYSGKWAKAGMVRGNECSLAWRVLDAQYWGVPQRRKRIFLVADFKGQSAPEILFEQKGVPGDIAESKETKEEVATVVEKGPGNTKQVVCGISSYSSNAMKSSNPYSGIYEAKTARTLDSQGGSPACNQGGMAIVEPLLFENHASDCRVSGPCKVSPTVTRRWGTGGGNVPLVAGFREQRSGVYIEDDTASTLAARDHKSATDLVIQGSCGEVVGALCARDYKGVGNQYVEEGKLVLEQGCVVRRLTPLECERLMGFPDGWTEGGSDAPRYKALGNSVAVPCVEWIMGQLAQAMREEE